MKQRDSESLANRVGLFSESWLEDSFELYTGKLEISNGEF